MNRLIAFLAVGLLSFATIDAQAGLCPAVSDRYKVFATAPLPNMASAPSYYVQAQLLPIMIDIDDMEVASIPLGIPSVIVGASGDGGEYFAKYVSTLPANQMPVSPSASAADLGFSATIISTQAAAGCPSLAFMKANASFMLEFNLDGTIRNVQRLDSAAVGFDIAALAAKAADVNADGRQDLVLSQSGAVRAVLLAQADGTLKADAQASVMGVWASFMAACASGDRSAAANHFFGGASNFFAAPLLDTSNDIKNLSKGVVAVEALSASENLYTIRVVYQHLSPSEYVLYTLDVVGSGGGWYLQSM